MQKLKRRLRADWAEGSPAPQKGETLDEETETIHLPALGRKWDHFALSMMFKIENYSNFD